MVMMTMTDIADFTLIGKKLYKDTLWVSVYIQPGDMPIPYVKVTHLDGKVVIEGFLNDWVLPSSTLN